MGNASKVLVGVLVGLGALVLVVALWVMGAYNGLVQLDENVNEKWGNVETQYQRRFDLVPNLVSIVEGSANFEQGTLTAVTAARSAWAQSKSSGDVAGEMQAANSFDSALSRLLVTVEAYPDLKTTAAFQDLQSQLEGTENRIQYARQEYNAIVKEYNVGVRIFPTNLVAMVFGFGNKLMFESAEGAEKAVDVEFNFNQ